MSTNHTPFERRPTPPRRTGERGNLELDQGGQQHPATVVGVDRVKRGERRHRHPQRARYVFPNLGKCEIVKGEKRGGGWRCDASWMLWHDVTRLP